MRDYTKISPEVWHSKRFRSCSDDAKLAFLYALTSRHQNSAGAYHLPDEYAAADMGWAFERFQNARVELVDKDLIGYDADTSVIMIKRWFRHNAPTNINHYIGTQKLVSRLPSEAIKAAVSIELDEIWNARRPNKIASSVNQDRLPLAKDRLNDTEFMRRSRPKDLLHNNRRS